MLGTKFEIRCGGLYSSYGASSSSSDLLLFLLPRGRPLPLRLDLGELDPSRPWDPRLLLLLPPLLLDEKADATVAAETPPAAAAAATAG